MLHVCIYVVLFITSILPTWEFDFSLMMKVKQFTLNSCAEQFTEVWAKAPSAPCSVPLEHGGWGRKVYFRMKVRKAGEEAKYLFFKTIQLSLVL